MTDREKPSPLKARKEISAGLIVFRRTSVGLKFLLLYHGGNYWNFPKGHIESEEKSFAAALRETKEEAGLWPRDLRPSQHFKAYERFSFRREGNLIYKIVIFYLAETRKWEIKISLEHQGYGWFLYSEATKILGKYRDSQKVLKQAYDFIREASLKHRRPHSSRRHYELPRGGSPGRPAPGLSGSR